jgi:predicted unusual protein kinase regulating ubiquinone biosynthesis (AarF/ABC1/UbiB family)
MGFVAMVEGFRRSVMAELDYSLEAGNLRVLHEQLASHRRIVVPLPVGDYCSTRVLTMELVDGRSISSIGPLARLELDSRQLAEELFRAYLDQVLVHGFFHADPHPGNVLLTADGRLALVDAGMVARLSPGVRRRLLRLLLALSGGEGTEAAAALEELGEPFEEYDADDLRRRVTEVVMRAEGATVEEMEIGRQLGDLVRAAADCGLRLPVELSFLGRALLNLDAVARVLDPTVSPGSVMRRHAVHVMRHGMLEDLSPARLLSTAVDAKDFVERLPGRLNQVLDALAEGKFTLNVEGVDESELMRVGQKLANRAATGVVIAALLLAAGLFARAGGGLRLWGYPVLTIVLLLLALAGALWLLLGVIRSDLPQRRRRARE